MTLAQELAKQTENLYQIFSGYIRPEKIEGCPHCFDPKAESKLHAKALHELTSADLDRFVFKALTTWGDVPTFKHFLPRIFELLYGSDRFFDPELIADKLLYGKWYDWPAVEQQAIKNFVNAWWRFELATLDTTWPGRLSQILTFIGLLETDLQPYLLEWQNCYLASDASLLNLAGFISNERDNLWRDKNFLQPAQLNQLKKWLASQAELPQSLESQFFANSDNDKYTSQILSESLDYLSSLK